MPFISIEGCSGAGKSLLTSQLSALARWPAISEGESGVIPDWVFQSFSRPELATPRTVWFIERCLMACYRARDVAGPHRYSFLDSGPLTAEAYIRVDHQADHGLVSVHSPALRRAKPDVTVLLIASESVIRSRIMARSRTPQENEDFVQRVLTVQNQCLELAHLYDTLVIQCDGKDFRDESALRQLWQIIAKQTLPLEARNS